MQRLYAKYYVPNNAAVFVSGDVSTPAVRKMVADAFGDWSKASDPVLKPAVVSLAKTTFVLVPASVSDVTYLVAVQGPANGPADTDAVPAEALVRVLNSPASAWQGRLVDNGMFSSMTASYQGFRFDGTMTFRGRTDLPHAPKALLALLNEMDVMDAMQDVSDEDLMFARRADQVGKADRCPGPEWAGTPPLGLVGRTGFVRLWHHRPTVRGRAARRLDPDCEHFYVAGHPRVVGILAPPRAIDVFRNWLSGQGALK